MVDLKLDLERSPIEETLDSTDWEAMRTLGYRMVDDMMTYLETVRQRHVWQPIPEKVKIALAWPSRRPIMVQRLRRSTVTWFQGAESKVASQFPHLPS